MSDVTLGGTIKRIKLKNFMGCKRFEMDFNPKMNVIVTSDSSTKQLIEIGIVIGLGGDVTDVSGTIDSLKDLISPDCFFSSITITLHNKGPNMYKIDIYGDEISIKRTLSVINKSVYKICSKRGEPMACEKEELDKILVNFNIPVKNTIGVISEGALKNFISEADVRSYYEVYEEIEQMEIQMEMLRRLHQSMENKRKLEMELTWSRKVELVATKNEMEKMFDELEKQRDDDRSKLREVKKNVMLYMVRLERMTGKQFDDADYKKDQAVIHDELKTNRIQFDNACLDREAVERELERNKKMLKAIDTRCEKVLDNIERVKNDIEIFRELITKYKNMLKERDEIKENSRKEIESIKNQIDDFLNEIPSRKEGRAILVSEAKGYRVKLREELNILREYRRKINENTRRIDELKNERLLRYANWMPELMKHVNIANNLGGFSLTPRGPVGMYIKVDDKKWTLAVESYLKKDLLTTFLVKTNVDEMVLSRIMDYVIPAGEARPKIRAGGFLTYVPSVSLKNQVTYKNYSNMYKALTIEDPVVENLLIRYAKVDKVLLVPTNRECVVFRNPANVPKNCLKLVNLRGDIILPFPNCKYYKNVNPVAPSLLVREDKSHIIKSLEDETVKYKNYAIKQESVVQQWAYKLRGFQIDIIRHNISLLRLPDVIVAKKEEVKKLKNLIKEHEAEEVTDRVVIRCYRREIVSLNKNIKPLQDRLKKVGEPRSEREMIVKNIEEKLKAAKMRCESLQLQEQILLDEDRYHRSVEERERLSANIQRATDKLWTLRYALRDIQKEIRPAVLATEGNRIENPRPAQELSQEILLFDGHINEIQHQLQDCEDEESNSRKKLCFKNWKGKIVTKKSKQQTVPENVRSALSARISDSFRETLKNCDYTGNIVFDHNSKHLIVTITEGYEAKEVSNAGLLSDKERLLLSMVFFSSLWLTTRQPFYFVNISFMLESNQFHKTMIQFLLSRALGAKRQFIIFIPSDNFATEQDHSA